jgi:protein-tyrosine phosphatase
MNCFNLRKKIFLSSFLYSVNRSATIIIAYLMYKQSKDLISAYQIVKSKRKSICPLRDNRIELYTFEQKLFGKHTCSLDEFLRKR